MEYKIIGSIMPVVETTLSKGEAMYTQSGGMCWMEKDIDMETNTRGGFMKGLGRMFAGESLFMTTYRAQREGAMVAFAATVPGEILPVEMNGGRRIICQKGAFLCAEEGVEVRAVVTKKASAGFFGGEGFILQEVSGSGKVFLEVDGSLVKKVLMPGEVLKIDTGNVVAFDASMKYEVETVKGGKNIIFGGEGLFLTTLTGPGTVLLQSQNFAEFALRVAQYVPSRD